MQSLLTTRRKTGPKEEEGSGYLLQWWDPSHWKTKPAWLESHTASTPSMDLLAILGMLLLSLLEWQGLPAVEISFFIVNLVVRLSLLMWEAHLSRAALLAQETATTVAIRSLKTRRYPQEKWLVLSTKNWRTVVRLALFEVAWLHEKPVKRCLLEVLAPKSKVSSGDGKQSLSNYNVGKYQDRSSFKQ